MCTLISGVKCNVTATNKLKTAPTKFSIYKVILSALFDRQKFFCKTVNEYVQCYLLKQIPILQTRSSKLAR